MVFLVEDFTIGIEEEYQIVSPKSRKLLSHANRILRRAERQLGEDEVQPELYQSQIEIGTPICRTLDDVRNALVRLRRAVIVAAETDGCRIAAAGTHPFSRWQDQEVTPEERYVGLVEEYGQLAREEIVFGCHVHVGMRDREAAIQVINRSRPWLAVMLALSGNSPFWAGVDTGYASYRTEIFSRLPLVDIPQVFASRSEYEELIQDLIATGCIEDASRVYWEVRPSHWFETVEYRIADVCLEIDEAVMIAGLTRSLARTCHAQAARDDPIEHPRPELLQAAKWRAARHGLTDTLIDVPHRRLVPAPDLVGQFLNLLRPDLEEHGEWDEITALVGQTLERGTGSERQRAVFQRTGRLEDVVDFVVEETAKGIA